LTARDLLSITDASLANRFDEQVLLALNERRVNRLEKRNEVKDDLQDLTARLKVFGEVQSKIHTQQSNNSRYNPASYKFSHSDFGYGSEEAFKKSPEYAYLHSIAPDKQVSEISHMDFLKKEGVDAQNKTYQNKKDEPTYLTDFSSSISDKSKLLNDEVQIKTTTLNDLSSQYNSTVEAMNKFVQKFHSILEQILRAI
jgi:hypothetical protein